MWLYELLSSGWWSSSEVIDFDIVYKGVVVCLIIWFLVWFGFGFVYVCVWACSSYIQVFLCIPDGREEELWNLEYNLSLFSWIMCCHSVMPSSKSRLFFLYSIQLHPACTGIPVSVSNRDSDQVRLLSSRPCSVLLKAESKWLQPNRSQLQRKDRNLFPGSIWCNKFSEFLAKIRCMLTPVGTHHQLSIVSDSSWRNCMYFWWSVITLIIFQPLDSMSWVPSSHFFLCITSVDGLLPSQLTF